MSTGQFFPSGYGYGFVCPLGTLPTAIPSFSSGDLDRVGGLRFVTGDETMDFVSKLPGLCGTPLS